jgi:hypothetical protein
VFDCSCELDSFSRRASDVQRRVKQCKEALLLIQPMEYRKLMMTGRRVDLKRVDAVDGP